MIFNPVIPNSGGGGTSEWIDHQIEGDNGGKFVTFRLELPKPERGRLYPSYFMIWEAEPNALS